MASPADAVTVGDYRRATVNPRERGRGGKKRNADFISHRGDFPQARLRSASLAPQRRELRIE